MHLYVHVPFCARRCSYCDFAIAVRRVDPSAAFAETIVSEWRAWLDAPWWPEVGPIETIYFGGGTPSSVAPAALEAVLRAVRAERSVRRDAEVTLEANPEDVTPARAQAWAELGITRVSLGVQSFDPVVLRWMHRVHGPEQPERAVQALAAASLRNTSVDLIYGLPEQLNRDWQADLDRAWSLGPKHLSLYALTVESGTPLGKWVARGESPPPVEGRAADEFLGAAAWLAERGLRHYEVSNAGLPGFESRHNRAYWARRSYLGLGPSAHSAHAGERWWNVREWEAYRRSIGARGRAVAGAETLSASQVRLEELYLGLRTDQGVSASSLPRVLTEQWLGAGWARRDGSQIRLTPQGWLRLDALVRQVDGV